MAQIKTMADIEAMEATPLEDRNLPQSTYAAFEYLAETFGDAPALSFFLQATDYKNTVQFSFNELLGKMTQTANMLNGLGVGPTDTVSYILPNLPETYFTLYGSEAAGISNPINPLLEPEVLAEIMNAAETKVLVTLAPFPSTDIWEKVASIVDDVPTLKTILQLDIADYLSGVKKLVVNLIRMFKPKASVRAQVLNFNKTLAQYPSDKLTSGREIGPDEIASYFHTGGTTGTPKLALHSHFNEVFDGWAAGEMIDGQAGEKNLLGLPLFHNYGAIAVGIGSWFAGAEILLATPQGFRGEGMIDNFWKILDDHNCTYFSGVPTLFTTLLNTPLGGANVSRVKCATSGAAPLPVEVANQFTEMTGIRILEGYGLTEGTSANSVNPLLGEQRIGSVGFRLPYQEMNAAILEDGEFVRFAEVNEVGAISLRGPNAFPGYRDEFHNEGSFFETGDGKGRWVNTGDLGRMDPEGYFWLTGRKKELIIRGGHNIDPKLIEEPMHTHPAVALAAAVGKPDPRVGEMPMVFVELKPDASATVDELIAFAGENIGERAAVPKEIRILPEIPLTAVGKIFKPALTRQLVEEVYGEELSQIDGVASSTVVAEGDKKRGTIAYVTVTPADGADTEALESAIRSALGAYTVYFELTMK